MPQSGSWFVCMRSLALDPGPWVDLSSSAEFSDALGGGGAAAVMGVRRLTPRGKSAQAGMVGKFWCCRVAHDPNGPEWARVSAHRGMHAREPRSAEGLTFGGAVFRRRARRGRQRPVRPSSPVYLRFIWMQWL